LRDLPPTAHCEPDRILLSRSTWFFVRDEVACDPIGEIQVKGFQQAIQAYEIRPLDPAPTTA